ncbi:MAG: NADH-quinone oxidoreductase subunit L [Alphaproteobacteria bacterium]|nr:NADH-quinone oxidoreductase subunit L [Alphaproteobacteria bacterium]
MYTAIVFLPLLGSAIAGLFGRAIGARASELVTTGLLFVSAALSCYAFYDVTMLGHSAIVPIANWIESGDFRVDWSLRIDSLTAVMLVVVTGVSSLVHLYSVGYMHEDPHRPRFFSYLSLFTFAMLMLVTSNNLLQMFFGWEGVGLASYLLIGFWFEKPSANAAAIKAFLVNRVGDFGFALGVFGLWAVFGTLDFDAIFMAAPMMAGKTFAFAGYQVDILTTLCILLFIGACGKSAQLFLHTWLPDAMEGPTPVSALIHAATMVTAGVFLVCRASPLFELAPIARDVVAVVGASTAFFAASVGLFQNDIKRVVAYSTCSQLGYMFFAAGVSAYNTAMFHLFTHAFFKALLFLGAGSVIHAMHHEQDMRHMGALMKKIPYTWAMMLIGTIALTGLGIPFLHIGAAGFYSKDMILESAFMAHTGPGMYAFTLGIVAAGMTSFYSWRLMFMTFNGPIRGDHHHWEEAHESPATMMIPLVVLSVGALFAGMLFFALFVGEGQAEFWRGALIVHEHAEGAIPEWVILAPLVVSLIGLYVAYYYYILHPELPPQMAARGGMLYTFLYKKWYFDELYDFIFVRSAKWLGRKLWKICDGMIIDGLGPDGISKRVLDATRGAVLLQSGYVYHYAFAMLVGVAALITWFLFSGGPV